MKIPRALAHLSREPNPAADWAIVEALPSLDAEAQADAVALLALRGRTPSLAAVVGLFSSASPLLQEQILFRLPAFSKGIRLAAESDRFEDRTSAFELIVRGEDASNCFLLANALRSPCPRTREIAGKGLLRLAETVSNLQSMAAHSDDEGGLRYLADELATALARGLATWEIHQRLEVIQAALGLIDRLEPVIRKKLTDRHSSIARPLKRILEGYSDPKTAGFAVRALALPGLESAAGHSIGNAKDNMFLRAVLANGYLLIDPRIRKGCRRIRAIPWLESDHQLPGRLEEREIESAMRMLAASGVRREAKVRLFRSWLFSENGRLSKAVAWWLIRDRRDEATDLLLDYSRRCHGDLAQRAAWEVRRRRPDDHELPPPAGSSCSMNASGSVRYAFDRYWEVLGRLTPEEETALTRSLRPLGDQLLISIRSRLASSEASDRFRSLRIVSELSLAAKMPQQIFQLCHDPDPRVRSFAVTLLTQMPGPTTGRILRAAVNDPDDRVQANAIEAAEQVGQEDRIEFTKPKLQSPSNRVRANAVKSLLRAECEVAGRTLLDMLRAQSPSDRLSAMWVVERLGLHAVVAEASQLSDRGRYGCVQQRAAGVPQSAAGGFEAQPQLGTSDPSSRNPRHVGAP